MKQFMLFLMLFGFVQSKLLAQQQKNIHYYQQLAYDNNPVLQQNRNTQHLVLLQNDLLKLSNNRPQIYLTGDLLFTPSLLRNGKPISFNNNYEENGLGYDGASGNHTTYAGQINLAQNILNKKIIRAGTNQNNAFNRTVDLLSRQLMHDIDKNVSDQYITIYQTQLQMRYVNQIIQKIIDRRNVVEQLVRKGVMAESDFLILGMTLKEEENGYELLRIQLINQVGQLHSLCNLPDTTIGEFEKPDLVLGIPLSEFQYQQKFQADSQYAVYQQKVSETKYLPQLTLIANSGVYSYNISTMYRNIGFSGGVHLNVPIYDGMQRRNVAQQYHLEKENLKIGRDFAERQLHTNLNYLLQEIHATEKSIGLMNEQIKSHDQLLNILKEKLVLGQTSVTDYLVSLQDYAATCRNKAVTETNLLLLINQYNYLNW